MAAVPIVLERLKKGVTDKIAKESKLKQTLFNLAYEKKLKKFQAGKCTHMLDKIIFSKMNQLIVGGRLRQMLVGGALVNKEIQEFGQVCL
jgi:long-subunit acyl-CoA synthetase (AMP-forming)